VALKLLTTRGSKQEDLFLNVFMCEIDWKRMKEFEK